MIVFQKALRCFVVCTLMLCSGALLCTGLLRLFQYDLPMWRGDYKTAATEAVTFGHAPGEEELPLNGLAGETVTQKLLTQLVSGVNHYQDWACGDRLEAKWNHAHELYKQEQWSEAMQAFQRAFAACCDESGAVRPQYRERGSVIQVMIGNSFERQQKSSEAYPFYEAALSAALNPDNKVATYNLERLQDSQSGGANDKGKVPKNSPSGKNPGKPAHKL